MVFGKKCPSADKLQAFAVGDATSKGLAAHVAGCETCQKIVANMQSDEQLVTELRAADSADIDPAVRKRILDICRKAVDETAS